MAERIKKLRDFFGKPKKRDFTSWKTFVNSPVMTWLFLIVFALLITIFTKFSIGDIPSLVEEGSIATRDIKADRNYEIVDKEATDKFKTDATAKVIAVFDFNEGAAQDTAQKIHRAFEVVREKLNVDLPTETAKKERINFMLEEENFNELEKLFSQELGITVKSKDFLALIKDDFSPQAEEVLTQVILDNLSSPIVANKETLSAEQEKGITLRYIKSEAGETKITEEKNIEDPSAISTIEQVRKEIKKQNARSPAYILSIAAELAEPNVVFDYSETGFRKALAQKGVQNVVMKVKAGEMIVRNGARFNTRHIKILNGIREEKIRATYPMEFFGTMLFVLLSIIIVFYFAERFVLRFRPSRRDYILMAIVATGHILVLRLGFSLAPVFHSALPFDIPVEALILAIPIASSAMLLRMLLHAEDTFIYLISATLLSSIFSEVDLQYISFFIISNIAGIIAIANTDKRSAIIKAGAITGIINIIAILGIKLIGLATISVTATLHEIIWSIFCAFLGGLLSAMLVLIAAPLIESLLGYTTDIKLLELANLNHPLLRELIVRAPGTYHHSHLTGIIAEAAAESVGANPLLVRVAAYYHDIGKTRKPLYFVENTKNGEDRHVKLSPHMSALIISSHVSDGVDMAQEIKLPQSIIDIMREHHGTRQISYFYEKAKAKQQDSETEKLDSADFEYDGPKPQTREAAIMMLADVSEASVRSLKEKSPARIEQTVDRVIDDCFKEKQLDECDLTLRDLNEISKAFIRLLLGIYHQRIEYQKDSAPRREGSVLEKEKASENKDSKSSSETQNNTGADKKKDK